MPQLKISIIEDDPQIQANLIDFCKLIEKELGITILYTCYSHSREFHKDLEKNKPDILIVDLHLGDGQETREGWNAVKDILNFEIIPVIVYSAYTDEAIQEIFKNVLIRMVQKGSPDTELLKNSLTNAVKIKLSYLNQKKRILKEFSKISLESTRNILNIENGELPDEDILTFMSITRLTSYLTRATPPETGKFPPESMFIYPPLKIDPYPEDCLFLGDFLENTDDHGIKTLWVVKSPSCDLFFSKTRHAKIRDVLLVRCFKKSEEYPPFADKEKEGKRSSLSDGLKRKTCILLKSPASLMGCPAIMISFKDYYTIPYSEIRSGLKKGSWKKIASLASPYAEALQNLFISDLSRIGTPDTIDSNGEKKLITTFVE